MKVVMKNRWKKLGDLKPRQRFRFKDQPENSEVLFVVVGVNIRTNWVEWDRATDSLRSESPADIPVYVVPGHWQPDEEEGLVRVGDVPDRSVVEYNNVLWHKANTVAGPCRLQCLETGQRAEFVHHELVRVFHGAFVEDGAKIEEACHE